MRLRKLSRRTTVLFALLMFTLPIRSTGLVPEPTPNLPAVVRGNDWYLRNSLTSGVADLAFKYGTAGDIPIMGDWDGNGSRTAGVVRGNVWYLKNDNSSGFADTVVTYGKIGDTPIVGDWDGDGIETVGVVRVKPPECQSDACVHFLPSWHLRNSNTTGVADITFSFGGKLVGDWDSDDVDTPGGKIGTRWLINNDFDITADDEFLFGNSADLAIVGDWDGDGDDSPGVVRHNTWYIRNENTSGTADDAFLYGKATDFFLVWR